MAIAWPSFTPWPALAGGLLIGLAAALLVLFNGRIAGISGIVGGLRPVRGDLGAGWGLAGFCPGSALVALGLGAPQAVVFVAAMLAGMGMFELIEARRKRQCRELEIR